MFLNILILFLLLMFWESILVLFVVACVVILDGIDYLFRQVKEIMRIVFDRRSKK